MKERLTIALAALLFGLSPALAQDAGESAASEKTSRPRVEVMFVLDTTGSMGGLIEGAKVKIWKIVNRIVSGEPRPDLKVGLVGYRDRGDAYVTKLTPLTDDLDEIYGVLRGFSARGGGDTPESVNQALHEALTKPAWSTDERTLRIIYLVGDAPPHMDYESDVKYPVTCEKAARAGIIVNTIQCGKIAGTAKIWEDIAKRAEGRYVRIEQSGGMTAAVKTPYDDRLAELARELSGTAVYYGEKRAREEEKKAKDEADDAAAAAPEAAAERAGFFGKSGRISRLDLLDKLEREELDLEELEEELLPKELKEMSAEERKAHIEELLAKRRALREEVVELDRKRAEYIEKERAKEGAKKDGFDEQVFDMLKEQAKRVGITWK